MASNIERVYEDLWKATDSLQAAAARIGLAARTSTGLYTRVQGLALPDNIVDLARKTQEKTPTTAQVERLTEWAAHMTAVENRMRRYVR